MAVALLKTPTAQLAVNGGSQHPDKRREGGHGPTLADQVEHQLLPTPNATDWKGSGATQGRERGGRPRPAGDADLPEAVALLPTPNWGDARHYESMEHYRQRDAAARAANPKLGALHLPLPTVVEALSDGDHTSPPSRDGNPSPDAELPGQLSLDEPESG